MRALLNVGLLLLFVTVQAKVYELCEFARIMNKSGMEGYGGFSLENWPCTTCVLGTLWKPEEGFHFRERELQILKSCHVGAGNQVLFLVQDDITESIKCAKIIAQAPQAMRAWYGWRTYCENRDLTKYLQKCTL